MKYYVIENRNVGIIGSPGFVEKCKVCDRRQNGSC